MAEEDCVLVTNLARSADVTVLTKDGSVVEASAASVVALPPVRVIGVFFGARVHELLHVGLNVVDPPLRIV